MRNAAEPKERPGADRVPRSRHGRGRIPRSADQARRGAGARRAGRHRCPPLCALSLRPARAKRTGASSVVGTEAVVRSPPDGYTLLFGSSSSFAVNPAVIKNLRFDVQKDLKLVGLVSYTPHVLVVRASLATGTLKELIALAKAQP